MCMSILGTINSVLFLIKCMTTRGHKNLCQSNTQICKHTRIGTLISILWMTRDNAWSYLCSMYNEWKMHSINRKGMNIIFKCSFYSWYNKTMIYMENKIRMD